MSTLDEVLRPALAERRDQHLLRKRRRLQGPQQPHVRVDGRPALNFCSNDYLGLANHPAVVEAAVRSLQDNGLGAGASHLVCGHTAAHEALEAELAELTGRPRALLFGSGYLANLGVLTTLLGSGDCVLEDRLNHASLLDGGLFSRAAFSRYAHCDMDSLEQRLQAHAGTKRRLVVSDGVFSMDGDIAPLAKLCRVAQAHDAWVMLDDAHGFGVLGPQGDGLVGALRAEGVSLDESQCQIIVGTLGKAFGTAGAFVAGSDVLIETLIQFCRPYIYTTAMPAALASATLASVALARREHWRREWLGRMIERFRSHCEQLGLQVLPSSTPIQALVLGEAEQALQASQILAESGLLVCAIRPPTVAVGTARLRITFSAAHTEDDLAALLAGMSRVAAFLQ